MTDEAQEKRRPDGQKPGFLHSVYNSAAYMREHKTEPVSVITALSLGGLLMFTTALNPVMAVPYGLGALGLLGISILTLGKTSEILVDNALAVGAKKRLSAAIIGIGLGLLTSFPELTTSTISMLKGFTDIALENIVGSNIANPFAALAATAMFMPIVASKALTTSFNTLVLGASAAALGLFSFMGVIPPLGAAALLLGTAGYLGYMIMKDKPDVNLDKPEEKQQALRKLPNAFNYLFGLGGLFGLVASSNLLIESARAFVAGTGFIPETMVGPFFVAAGTSIPELMVSVQAARKGKTETAIFNIVGSGILNVLMVGGIVSGLYAAVNQTGLPIPESLDPATNLGKLNMVFFSAATALLGHTLLFEKNISRLKAGAWLGLYGAFIFASAYLGGGTNEAPAAKAALEPPAITETIETPALPPPVPS